MNFKTINNGFLKDVDSKKGIVTGYFAAFNNIDSGGDMIIQGAFKKSIQERGKGGKDLIFHLLQHNTEQVLGKPNVLKEDATGLYFETEIVKTSFGEDTLKLYDANVYNQHSIGYREIKTERVEIPATTEKPSGVFYKLLELKLFEGSTVTWGMNENTPFLGMKSGENEINFITGKMNRVLKALKVGCLTDETLNNLEIELNQLQNIFNSLLNEKKQPDDSTEKNIQKPDASFWTCLNNVNF